jgi:hypothetical protein
MIIRLLRFNDISDIYNAVSENIRFDKITKETVNSR